MYKYNHIDEMATQTGVAWSALITYYGDKVCEVYNGGDGGCNTYRFATKQGETEFNNWAKTAYPDAFEPTDFAVEQLWEESL
jgi:hypothetical protein